MRKKLYPVLKAAKQEKRTAFFKVERLIIDGNYRKIYFLYDWSRKRFQNKMVCFFVSFKYGVKFCLLN